MELWIWEVFDSGQPEFQLSSFCSVGTAFFHFVAKKFESPNQLFFGHISLFLPIFCVQLNSHFASRHEWQTSFNWSYWYEELDDFLPWISEKRCGNCNKIRIQRHGYVCFNSFFLTENFVLVRFCEQRNGHVLKSELFVIWSCALNCKYWTPL